MSERRRQLVRLTVREHGHITAIGVDGEDGTVYPIQLYAQLTVSGSMATAAV